MIRAALRVAAFFAAPLSGFAATEPPCRARLEVAPETPFVEQAVEWRLRIESRPSVNRIDWIVAPSFPSARAERVMILPDTPLDTGWRLRREERMVFPERPGRLRLPAARLACESDDGRHVLEVAPRTLEVRALPAAQRPAGFQGLVGPLTLRRYLRPESLTLGEAARVTTSLRGAGNVWAAVDPHGSLALDDAEVFFLPVQTGIERSGGLRVSKVFEAEIVPRHTGVVTLPGLRVSWFDPESGRYQEESVPPLTLRVGARAVAPTPKSVPAPATRRVERSRGVAELLPDAWLWTPVPAALILGVLATLAFGVRRRRARLARPEANDTGNEDDPAIRAERALRQALAAHLPETARLAPAAILARDDLSPAQRAAAELLARAERARYDRDAPIPPPAEVARRIDGLRRR